MRDTFYYKFTDSNTLKTVKGAKHSSHIVSNAEIEDLTQQSRADRQMPRTLHEQMFAEGEAGLE